MPIYFELVTISDMVNNADGKIYLKFIDHFA